MKGRVVVLDDLSIPEALATSNESALDVPRESAMKELSDILGQEHFKKLLEFIESPENKEGKKSIVLIVGIISLRSKY